MDDGSINSAQQRSGEDPAGLGIAAVDVLRCLEEGNARFVAGRSEHRDITLERRTQTVLDGQRPLATIIACSDSRVPPEILFDQGIGRLFVVRVAGNVCGVDQIGSIEYAVSHLATPLVIVMAHTHCGAVNAAIQGEQPPGSISAILEKIQPAVDKVRREIVCLDEAQLAEKVAEVNAWRAIDDLLQNSPIVREQVATGKVTVMAAKYDTRSGLIYWLGQQQTDNWGY